MCHEPKRRNHRLEQTDKCGRVSPTRHKQLAKAKEFEKKNFPLKMYKNRDLDKEDIDVCLLYLLSTNVPSIFIDHKRCLT